MNFIKSYFSEFDSKKWDSIIKTIDGATYLHSSDMIKYYTAFDKKIKNLSFLVRDQELNYVACVVIGITKTKSKNIYSFSETLCPTPALIDAKYSIRNRIKKYVWNEILTISKKFNIKILKLIQLPINNQCLRNKNISSAYSFESLQFLDNIDVINTLILNLRQSDEKIYNNMSKYRKRDIKRSIKENIKIDVIDFKDTKRVELEMEEFRLAHLKAAKRITRPKETWAYMEKILKLNKAKLFIATKDQNKLSFLFCGQFGKSAFGWSQVNYKKYEKTYPVRHYLEWYAIKYFKKKNFLFYEVGQRYYVNNKSKFSSKEIQISEFKERYGAKMYPIIYFESAINKINYGELNN